VDCLCLCVVKFFDCLRFFFLGGVGFCYFFVDCIFFVCFCVFLFVDIL